MITAITALAITGAIFLLHLGIPESL